MHSKVKLQLTVFARQILCLLTIETLRRRSTAGRLKGNALSHLTYLKIKEKNYC